MAATPKRALITEGSLKGKTWCYEAINEASKMLNEELPMISEEGKVIWEKVTVEGKNITSICVIKIETPGKIVSKIICILHEHTYQKA